VREFQKTRNADETGGPHAADTEGKIEDSILGRNTTDPRKKKGKKTPPGSLPEKCEKMNSKTSVWPEGHSGRSVAGKTGGGGRGGGGIGGGRKTLARISFRGISKRPYWVRKSVAKAAMAGTRGREKLLHRRSNSQVNQIKSG